MSIIVKWRWSIIFYVKKPSYSRVSCINYYHYSNDSSNDNTEHHSTQSRQSLDSAQSLAPSHVPSTSQKPQVKQPRLCYSDLSAFIPVLHNHSLTDNDKYCLIQEHFIPAHTYKFTQIDVLFIITGIKLNIVGLLGIHDYYPWLNQAWFFIYSHCRWNDRLFKQRTTGSSFEVCKSWW